MSRCLWSMLTLVALGMPLHAQTDPLGQTRQDLALKAQKTLREVDLALSQAKAIEQYNPQRARQILRDCKAMLEDDSSLPERQRAELERRVAARINELTGQVAAQKKAEEIKAQQAEDKNIRQQQQKYPETKPSGATTLAKDRIGGVKDQIAALDRLKANRERGFLGILNSVGDYSVPANGLIEFPAHWERITDLRKQKLHPKEVALLKALNSTMSVDFKGQTFSEVIDYIQEKTGQAIIIDENSLKEAMVESNDQVTFKAPKVTVRTILRKVLADRGLGYIITDATIHVVTAQRARETMVVRTYPVSDLVGADPRFYGAYTPLVVYQNAQNLINLIQTSIEPSIWQPSGGTASITFHPQSLSLIIRAPAEMQYMFGGTGLLK